MLLKIFTRNLSDARLFQCYNILKVRRRATPEEIRDSFYKLSKLTHPDNLKTGNHRRFLKLKEAYELIKDAPLKVDRRPISKLTKSEGDDDDDTVKEDLSHIEYIHQLRITRGELVPDPDFEPKLYSGPNDSIMNMAVAWILKHRHRKAATDRRRIKIPDEFNGKKANMF